MKRDIGEAIVLTAASSKEGVVRLGVEAALPEISAWEGKLVADRSTGSG